MEKRKSYLYWGWAAFLFYCLAFIVFTFPLIQHFDTCYIGIPKSGDSSTYVWSIWHFRYAVMNGLSPFETHMFFYPMGSSLIMHGFIPSIGTLNLFIDNPVLTLNIALLLTFAFSGLGTFQLLRHFNIAPFLCFVGGFIFAFFPYKTVHLLEHFNLELTALLPYFVLFFIRTFRYEPGHFFPRIQSKRYFIYLILLSILSVFTDYYYSIYAFYFACLFSLINKVSPFFKKFTLKKNLMIFLVMVIAGHFIIRGFVITEVDDKGALWWSADVASLLVPDAGSLLYGGLESVRHYPSAYFRYPESVEFVMFMGYGFVALCILFLGYKKTISSDNTIRMMGVASLFFLLFCFPEFKILGHRLFYNVTGLLYYIPFLNNVRTPSRYQVMFMLLFLPVLMQVLTVLWQQKNFRWLITGLTIFIMAEYYPRPYTWLDAGNIPKVYQHLKDLPQGAVLPVPFGFRDGITQVGHFNTNQFLYQTCHQHPVIGGYISRLSKENLEQFSDNPTAQDLYRLMDNEKIEPPVKGSFSMPAKYIVAEPGTGKAIENYLDTAVGERLIRKSMIEDYILYEIR